MRECHRVPQCECSGWYELVLAVRTALEGDSGEMCSGGGRLYLWNLIELRDRLAFLAALRSVSVVEGMDARAAAAAMTNAKAPSNASPSGGTGQKRPWRPPEKMSILPFLLILLEQCSPRRRPPQWRRRHRQWC